MLWSRIHPPSEAGNVRVGRLLIDRRERIAWLEGRRLDLSPMLFQLLLRLAECPGRAVSRSELKSALWPYAVRIDTDRRLNTAVRALRVALGDGGQSPHLIETVRSHGYRWVSSARGSRLGAFAAALASLLATASLVLAMAPAGTPASGMALVEAQAAVDAWRQEPSEANLALATASVSRAGRADAAPAIHLLRAQLALEGRWDWATAERHYRRALALDGDNADAQLGLAWLEANRGRADRALALAERLAAISALTEDRRANLGWLLIRVGRPDLAAATCRPGAGSGINLLSCAHVALAETGRAADARHVAVNLMRKVGASPDAVRIVSEASATDGYKRFLEWRARHFLPANAPWFQRAQVLADAGYRREALEALNRSVAEHEPIAVKMGSTPSFAGLRSDERFRQLARQVGLPG